MEIITILVMCIVVLVVLAILLKLNWKNIRFIKEIGKNSKLNEITDSLPENETICKEILIMLGNKDVNIKVSDENRDASLYIVATNTIFIANIRNTFTRVQTIAHECVHSIQDKSLLWFNFVFSNIYLLYFAIITILTLFNKISIPSIFAIILVMMSVLLFFVRSYLEIDAMTRARFIAKEYMQKKIDDIGQENIDIIVENLDKLNHIGIKFYDLTLLFQFLFKVVIYCIVALI